MYTCLFLQKQQHSNNKSKNKEWGGEWCKRDTEGSSI